MLNYGEFFLSSLYFILWTVRWPFPIFKSALLILFMGGGRGWKGNANGDLAPVSKKTAMMVLLMNYRLSFQLFLAEICRYVYH